MPKVDDQQLGHGAVYARAILAVAEQRGLADQVLEELTELSALLDRDQAFAALLANPLVDDEAKSRLLEKALRGRASDLLVDSIQVIGRKERLELLPAIAEAYRREHRQARGIVDVEVRSAVPLSAELRARLAEAAARYTGKRPHLIERVDPSLIGGLVVQVGDDKIDSSIASRLKNLSAALLKRGAEEIHRGSAYTE
jgi:F-type H+-transporting ATPase subunit delta